MIARVQTKQKSDAVKRLFIDFLAAAQSKPVRDILPFAEEVIILPMDVGPYGGQPFNCRLQPYVELLYDEICSNGLPAN